MPSLIARFFGATSAASAGPARAVAARAFEKGTAGDWKRWLHEEEARISRGAAPRVKVFPFPALVTPDGFAFQARSPICACQRKMFSATSSHTMRSPAQWTLKKDDKGYTLLRPRQSVFSETVRLRIASSAAAEWHAALTRIVERIRTGRSRSLAPTLAIRCMLGRWRGAQSIRCFGGLPRHSCHVVGVDDSLYLLVELYNWAAYPISLHELESIASHMA